MQYKSSLNIFHLLTIYFKMNQAYFSAHIEIFLHLFSNTSLPIATTRNIILGNFKSQGFVCTKVPESDKVKVCCVAVKKQQFHKKRNKGNHNSSVAIHLHILLHLYISFCSVNYLHVWQLRPRHLSPYYSALSVTRVLNDALIV